MLWDVVKQGTTGISPYFRLQKLRDARYKVPITSAFMYNCNRGIFNPNAIHFPRKQIANSPGIRVKILSMFDACKRGRENNWRVIQRAIPRSGDAERRENIEQKFAKIIHAPYADLHFHGWTVVFLKRFIIFVLGEKLFQGTLPSFASRMCIMHVAATLWL